MNTPTESAETLHPAHDLLERHLMRLAGLIELPMRCALTRELLTQTPLEHLCWCLSQIVRGAIWGQNPHIDAMLALAITLVDELIRGSYALFQQLFEAAHTEQRQELLFLCRDAPPRRALSGKSRLPEVRLPLPRDVSLGERRAMAAGSDRRLLERLLMDPNPLVISKLLDNPALHLQDIIVIASRRPTKVELLSEVATSTRWLQHHNVREALARNPFVQTGVALRLLPTLHIKTVRQIRDSGDLHSGVCQFARLIVEIREWRMA